MSRQLTLTGKEGPSDNTIRQRQLVKDGLGLSHSEVCSIILDGTKPIDLETVRMAMDYHDVGPKKALRNVIVVQSTGLDHIPIDVTERVAHPINWDSRGYHGHCEDYCAGCDTHFYQLPVGDWSDSNPVNDVHISEHGEIDREINLVGGDLLYSGPLSDVTILCGMCHYSLMDYGYGYVMAHRGAIAHYKYWKGYYSPDYYNWREDRGVSSEIASRFTDYPDSYKHVSAPDQLKRDIFSGDLETEKPAVFVGRTDGANRELCIHNEDMDLFEFFCMVYEDR